MKRKWIVLLISANYKIKAEKRAENDSPSFSFEFNRKAGDAVFALYRDHSAVPLCHSLCNRKPQSERIIAPRCIGLVKALKDMGDILRGDSAARVLN